MLKRTIKVAKGVIFILLPLSLLSCSSSSVSEDAEEVCKCYSNLKQYENQNRKLKELQQCLYMQQNLQAKLNDISMYSDWPKEKYEAERDRVEDIILNCSSDI